MLLKLTPVANFTKIFHFCAKKYKPKLQVQKRCSIDFLMKMLPEKKLVKLTPDVENNRLWVGIRILSTQNCNSVPVNLWKRIFLFSFQYCIAKTSYLY